LETACGYNYDPEVARFATLVRFNGEDRQTGEFHYHGYTALLDNVQASVLDVKLCHFQSGSSIDARSRTLSQGLEGINSLSLPHFSVIIL